jgi:hypothetical protein
MLGTCRHLAYWPVAAPGWLHFKTARLGGHLSAVSLGAWDPLTNKGFSMALVPNISSARGEVLIRIGEPTAPSTPTLAYAYFAVTGVYVGEHRNCTGTLNCTVPAVRLGGGARFYQALDGHAAYMHTVFAPETLQLQLGYGPEGQRLIDTARGCMVDGYSIWEGLQANYGTYLWGCRGRWAVLPRCLEDAQLPWHCQYAVVVLV